MKIYFNHRKPLDWLISTELRPCSLLKKSLKFNQNSKEVPSTAFYINSELCIFSQDVFNGAYVLPFNIQAKITANETLLSNSNEIEKKYEKHKSKSLSLMRKARFNIMICFDTLINIDANFCRKKSFRSIYEM